MHAEEVVYLFPVQTTSHMPLNDLCLPLYFSTYSSPLRNCPTKTELLFLVEVHIALLLPTISLVHINATAKMPFEDNQF